MKKLFAILLALVMVCTLSLSAVAFEGSQDIVLVTQEQGSWQSFTSDPVTISGPGEYTLSLTGMDFDGSVMTVLYIKDATAVAEGDAFTGTSNLSGFTCLTKSIKINGTEVALTDGYRTGLTDTGVFDIAWFNIWDVSYMDAPTGKVNDIEVVIEIVDADAEAAPEAESEAAPEETETAPEATETAPETTAPAAEAETTATAPSTGIALAVIPAVVAMAAAVVSKKH